MKLTLVLSSLLVAEPVLAGEGFTWFSEIAHKFHIAEYTFSFGFVALLLTILGFVYKFSTHSIDNSVVPDKGVTLRNIIEFIGEFIFNLSKNTMPEAEAKRYFKIFVMLFLFIFTSNIMGLLPGFLPPTENFNTTFALGIFVFIYYNFHGIRVQGLIGHLKHFAGPLWYMAPLIFVLEIISHAMRPVTLGLRLRGNMMGDHAVLAIFSELVPYLVPIPFYVLGIFVCFMQAFVFTLLTMIYVGLSVETHDHGDHH
jgi:F-type H+-transporting ATPase subunit a